MLMRLRRYRVLIFAVISVLAFLHWRRLGKSQEPSASSVEHLRNYGSQEQPAIESPAGNLPLKESPVEDPTPKEIPNLDDYLPTTSTLSLSSSTFSTTSTSKSPTTLEVISSLKSSSSPTPAALSTPAPIVTPPSNSSNKPLLAPLAIAPHYDYEDINEELQADGKPKLHWRKSPEHFPVSAESIILLPTGKPKAIPRIQATKFAEETPVEKEAREAKLKAIRTSFSFSWDGYKEKAWLHDELMPLSGSFKDPFCGWAATLVDSIDTLWIMGMMEEFEAAVEAVNKIDFTTSMRHDIPLFETTIRYLGGLLGAFDISGGQYHSLLQKAVELAEVLMGAFDTPNRMPITYYHWKPAFASQPHRAGTRVVLAELGSLSVEFTRLAQLTKDNKYYDAIARITDALEAYQLDTKLPGLWPLSIDTSGCKKTADFSPYPVYGTQVPLNMTMPPNYKHLPELDQASVKSLSQSSEPEQARPEKKDEVAGAGHDHGWNAETSRKGKRQLGGSDILEPSTAKTEIVEVKPKIVSAVTGAEVTGDYDCEPQGLAAPFKAIKEDYSIGARADSVYEYMPKEYVLLGGSNDQYRNMYSKAARVIKEKLLFRPLIKERDRKVLLSGMVTITSTSTEQVEEFEHEGTHLTCFVGGMLGVGAQVFGHPEDLELAKQLTDGCIWAYESTATGIMPERFLAVPCKDNNDCPWNQTAWREALDPNRLSREHSRKMIQDMYEKEEARLALEAATEAPAQPETLANGTDQPNNIRELAAESTTKLVSGVEGNESVNGSGAQPTVSTLGTKNTEGHDAAAIKEKRHGTHGGLTAGLSENVDIPLPPAEASPAALVQDLTMIPGKKHVDLDRPEQKIGAQVEGAPKSEKTKSATLTYPAYSDPGHPSPDGVYEAYLPPLPLEHEEFVDARIENERLAPGFSRVQDKRYILRPEAIESVFIMYRITGDDYWRQKGWRMFLAIDAVTRAKFGASAIDDVTTSAPHVQDSMESFWLAETLKYFYLLFTDENVVSLDDYVLNTEAHPLKRPDAKVDETNRSGV